MTLPARNSRWESIPTRQNPRFPRNVHRAKRDPPKLVRRHSSQRSFAEATLRHFENDIIAEKQQDHPIGGKPPVAPRRKISDGLVDNRIRYDRKGRPIITFRRRSTNATACSDITFDSGFFSMYDDDDEDYDDDDDDDDDGEEEEEEVGSYISEEASLVDDDESAAVTMRLSNARSMAQSVPDLEEEEEQNDCDTVAVPRILILGLEPCSSSRQVHPSRIVTEQAGRQLSANMNAEVHTAVILTDGQVEDDSRDDRYILAMSSIKKNIQRAQPDAVIVVTEDSDTSDVTLEGYHNDQTTANTKVFHLLEALHRQDIPAYAKPIYGSGVCRQWSDRFQKAGLSDDDQDSIQKQLPIIFFHLPPRTPETAVYHHQPYLKPETSVKGLSVAVSSLASRLQAK